MDYSPPGPSVHGILQARILEWVAISFSRGSSQPGIKPKSLATQTNYLPSEPPGKNRAGTRWQPLIYYLLLLVLLLTIDTTSFMNYIARWSTLLDTMWQMPVTSNISRNFFLNLMVLAGRIKNICHLSSCQPTRWVKFNLTQSNIFHPRKDTVVFTCIILCIFIK